jgi:hypothetical protein
MVAVYSSVRWNRCRGLSKCVRRAQRQRAIVIYVEDRRASLKRWASAEPKTESI